MTHETETFHIADTHEANFMRLLEENKARIIRLCRAYTSSREDREDLFQEIAVQLWKGMPTFRGEAQASTWLYRIALNAALRFAEKQRRPKPARELLSWFEETTPHPADDTIRERAEQLQRCIQGLAEHDRAVIVLYLEECSYKEISHITGLSETNVGVKIKRIKEKLFQCMTRKEV